MMKKTLLCLTAAVGFAMPCFAGSNMVIDWNRAALEAIRIDHTAPPIATRNLAMMHVAIYDSVNAIDRAHQPYWVQIDPPANTSREAAVATAAYRILSQAYPDQIEYFDFVLYESLKKVEDSQSKTDGITLGQYVADEIIALRADDGWNAYVEYIPGNNPGDWRPTPPDYLPALLPQWATVTPWTMSNPSQFRAAAPPTLDSLQYATDVNEVKDLGRVDSVIRTADQSEIALFWADSPGTCTPPGHWNGIAQNCSEALGYGLGKDALLFAKLNVALADAAISCWDNKYHYSLWRPFHAITLADQDGNPLTDPDPTWTSFIVNPAFPEYSSGHSTFSAAAARILAYEFGTDHLAFTDVSDSLPGIYRSYSSFSEAAAEAGRSRIYGGIHYEFSNQIGQQTGADLADFVQENYFLPVVSETPILALPTYYRTEYINVFEAFNCTPGQRVNFVWDRDPGSRLLRGCPGVYIELNRPKRFGHCIADVNGYAVVDRKVPRGFRGQTRYGQVVQKQSCTVSNLVEGYFPR